MARPLFPSAPRQSKRLRVATPEPVRPVRRAPWPLPDVAAVVAAFCTPVELRRLCATSHACHADLSRRRLASRVTWQQVQRALARFLGAPLSQPWPAECYLSGSLLYGALSGGRWAPGNADFFVPNSRAVIQDVQRWLVSNGYRIAEVKHLHCSGYGKMYLEGTVQWVRTPPESSTSARPPYAYISDSDDDQFTGGPPLTWSDGGTYSWRLRDMGFREEPEWTPACRRHAPGPRLQLTIIGYEYEAKEPMASLLGADLALLENLCSATTLHVCAPFDVLNGRSVLRSHVLIGSDPVQSRRRERVRRYLDRGVVVVESEWEQVHESTDKPGPLGDKWWSDENNRRVLK